LFFDGDVIFREGQEGFEAFLVQEGSVQHSIWDRHEDRDIEIATIGAKSLFGEMALIDNSKRMATAMAIGDTVLVAVNKSEFEKRLRLIDDETRSLFEMLLQYVRKTLPLEERLKNSDVQETRIDQLARKTLATPCISAALNHKDSFLAALLQMIVQYTECRLPPS
jgi:CRP-like cAMP-binding protein